MEGQGDRGAGWSRSRAMENGMMESGVMESGVGAWTGEPVQGFGAGLRAPLEVKGRKLEGGLVVWCLSYVRFRTQAASECHEAAAVSVTAMETEEQGGGCGWNRLVGKPGFGGIVQVPDSDKGRVCTRDVPLC